LARGIALKEINDPNSTIILSFKDVKDKSYEVHGSIKDAKVEVVDPDALQHSPLGFSNCTTENSVPSGTDSF
jgi:hypothetical protein